MKKLIMILTLAILLSSFVYAKDLSDYPQMFIKSGKFNANIAVGNKAPAMYVILQSKLITSFNEQTGDQIIGKAKLASEINTLNQNLILIGNPCENELESLMDNYPLSCSYLNGKSGIFFVEVSGYNNLIVTGTDDDIKRLVDELVNYKKKDLKGSEHDVHSIEPKINEQKKMIEELNKKIANAAVEVSKIETKANLTPTPEIKVEPANKTKEQPIHEVPNVKPGIFRKVINWFKRMFG